MLTKVHLVKAMFFPVDMYGCESWTIKKSWVLKNWCSWTVVLERILQSPLDCKELQPVHPKGNLSWIFIGRTDAEAETPVLWPPDVKNWLIGKDPDTGKGWRQGKGMTEDKMVGWHHWLDRHEFEQALGVGDGQESLVCCSLCGHKESSDMTEQLNWTELKALNLPTSSDSCRFSDLSLPMSSHADHLCYWNMTGFGLFHSLCTCGIFLLECSLFWSLLGGFLPIMSVSTQI